jgi:hypothetical protein
MKKMTVKLAAIWSILLLVSIVFGCAAPTPAPAPAPDTPPSSPWEDIETIRVEPGQQLGSDDDYIRTEKFEYPNCDASLEATQSLGSATSIGRSITIGTTARAGVEAGIEIPATFKLQLELEVERTYQDEYQIERKRIDTINMGAAGGEHTIWVVGWLQQKWESNVSFAMEGKVYTVPYVYELTVPKIVSIDRILCPAPTIAYFKLNPSSIKVGDVTTLSWSVPDVSRVEISPDIGLTSPTGTRNVNPTETTDYTLIVENAAGMISDQTVTLIVEEVKPVISHFRASQTNIVAGASSKLSWSVSDATKVSINNGIGEVTKTGEVFVRPNETTIYVLTAENEAGNVDSEVSVIVQQSKPVISYFRASQTSIVAGASSELSWNAPGATKVSINNGIGEVEVAGKMVVNPTAPITYKLTAENEAGSVFATLEINLISASAIYVDDSNTSGNEDGSQVHPYNTIQEGINAAINLGVNRVDVAPGTYRENISMKSNVNVFGSGAKSTIIEGAADVNGVVSFSSVTNSILQDFTIKVPQPKAGYDRGVQFTGQTSGTAIFQNNIIIGTQYGIFVMTPSTPLIQNNTLVGLDDEQGIYIGNNPTSPTIRNNIIIGYKLGIHVVAGTAAPYPVIENNLLWDNTENYRSYPDQTGIRGNISINPLIASIGGNNFSLLENSPAVDSGKNNTQLPLTDYNGEKRILDGDGNGSLIVDIGVDEFNR